MPAQRYQRMSLIGEGGMGRVWLGWDHTLGRNVALKVPHGGGHSPAAAHLRHEAYIAARLEHPGIVTVHDVLEDADAPVFVMAYIRGVSLRERLRRATDADDRARLLRSVAEVCEAVGHAHARGIVHRDLSPSNVLVGDDGIARVVDWGVSVDLRDPPDALTPAGTPGYVAPELVAGEAPSQRSDVWTLGVLLHEVVYGARPDGRVPATRTSPELTAVITRALARDPAARYADAGELGADVRRWLEGRRVDAYDFPFWRLALYFVQRWRVPVAIAALGALFFVAAVGWGWSRSSAEAERAAEAEQAARRLADRAVLAEREADERADDAQRELARALAVEARGQLQRGQLREAERLAERALALDHTPVARGVLGLVRAEPRLVEVDGYDVPVCRDWWVHPQGGEVAVCAATTDLAEVYVRDRKLFDSRIATPEVAIRGDALHVNLRAPHAQRSEVRVVDVQSGEHRSSLPYRGDWIDYERTLTVAGVPRGTGSYVPFPECARGLRARASPSGEHIACSCLDDGHVYRLSSRRGVWELIGDVQEPLELVVLDDGDVWTASHNGLLTPVGTDDRAATMDERVRAMVAIAGRRAFWVQGARGTTRLYDVTSRAWSAALPASRYPIAVEPNGDVWAWHPSRTRRVRWRFDSQHRARIDVRYGISDVHWSPDSSTLWVINAAGTVHGVDRQSGQVTFEVQAGPGVGKCVDTSADGATLFATTVDAFAFEAFDVDRESRSVTHRESISTGHFLRRLIAVDDGSLFGVNDGMLFRARPGRPTELLFHYSVFSDLERSPDRTRWIAVAAERIVVGRGSEIVDEFDPAPAEESGYVGTISDDGTIVLASRVDLVVYGPGGEPVRRFSSRGTVVDAAVSPDGELLAVGTGDGVVELFRIRDGALLAEADAHGAMISTVAFAPDGAWLATGSWDATVRLYDVSAMRGVDGAATSP